MMRSYRWKHRAAAILTAAAVTAELTVPFMLPVHAENHLFITDIRLETGEDAVDKLEEEGYQVMLTGLNANSENGQQIYLGYKLNEGTPITNIILSPDVGDSLTDGAGIHYDCASHLDVDAGNGGGSGCIYFTHDMSVGAPIVGLDVLRADASENEELYAITNDGAEIVRNQNGTPADFERNSETVTIYLAQIRDGIVRPYISEIGIVTDTDKWNAIYPACERGYNYYIDGDIDNASDTYTLIAYKRTADASQAITNVTAITADTVQDLEAAQDQDSTEEGEQPSGSKLTAAVVDISGIEYVRVSSQPVAGEQPFYLYQTKEQAAGNPISMLYAETLEESSNFLFSTWASGYFFTQGITCACAYSMNESLFSSIQEDMTVLTKLPVLLLDDAGQDTITPNEEATSETTEDTSESEEESTDPEMESTSDEENTDAPVEESSDEPEIAPETEAAPGTEIAPESEQTPEAEPTDPPAAEPEGQAEPMHNTDLGLFAPLTVHAEEEAEPAEIEQTEADPADQGMTEPEVDENAPDEAETVENEDASDENADETLQVVGITMLTARDGLPERAVKINGMREESIQPPVLERTERTDRHNKFPASIFGGRGVLALVMGGVAVAGAAIAAIFIRKRRPVSKKNSGKR